MYRQSSSRNQRNKGFKVKHALQIFLLFAVCFWLIYQVRHSYDKKVFDDNDARNSQHLQTDDEILKLGRKDPHPQVKEPSKKNEKLDEEADEDIEVDIMAKEKEDKVKGGDGELDEHDQQKSDAELDRDKVIIDEEKELERVNEKKNGKVDTDRISKVEAEGSEDNLDHDRDTKNTHKAREEQYKADDASSAVTNEGQTSSSEIESGFTQNQTSTLGNEIKGIIGQNFTNSKVRDDETSGNRTSSMVNSEKGSEVLNSTSKGSNFEVTAESTDKLKLSNDTTEVGIELRDLPNGTEISTIDSSHARNDTDNVKGSAAGSNIQTVSEEHANNSSIAMVNSRLDSNTTEDSNTTDTILTGYVESNLGTFSDISNDQIALEHTAPSNASADTKDASEIIIIEKNRGAHLTETLGLSAEADGNTEGSESSNTENAGIIKNGTVDSVVTEDTLPQLDSVTSPDLRTEASNSEVAADE
ncbi:hypothetical protein DCAR_0624249 [Daucus carota subsp. sativus]|uniref:Uncharacterized protein n=1 Tax=Daucus carota subsp. sativus TaxID=79200 RepID=A0A164VQJ3_DAUCS|nr:PREDICTED: dentin sialophosphoprotein [Daucus carota subsp. sativus]XP_017255269.1 PREDICTED: dentin sialophosphoprotein [Daucus carota subsp. sativus]XP_017255270.1 PREDICTED: dentin sialophosphoprotein [Daucus carota subsp. sativus]XP_017255271.1 PREDICTED: dentin sialophosphoprotein [Daucus carota subsp. sativus]WOH04837.1 hypothetical protein DCAR_0624249 [Daucus carota subsp. sativus]